MFFIKKIPPPFLERATLKAIRLPIHMPPFSLDTIANSEEIQWIIYSFSSIPWKKLERRDSQNFLTVTDIRKRHKVNTKRTQNRTHQYRYHESSNLTFHLASLLESIHNHILMLTLAIFSPIEVPKVSERKFCSFATCKPHQLLNIFERI